MADADDKKQQEKREQEAVKTEAGDKKSLVARLLPVIIIAVVIVFFAGAGFTLGRLFAGSRAPRMPGASEQDESAQVNKLEAKDSAADSETTWYYHLEPVVANLDVTDVTRYVRAALTLEISSEVDEKRGTAFLDEKKPVLTNWLTVYLASLSLDDIRGNRSLKRIQSQVLDAFNEKLFPDSTPKIKHVLFKEFAIQ